MSTCLFFPTPHRMSSAIVSASSFLFHSHLVYFEQARNFQQQLFDAMRQECMVHPTSNAAGVPASEYCTQDYEWQPPPAYGFYDAARVSQIAKGKSAIDHSLCCLSCGRLLLYSATTALRRSSHGPKRDRITEQYCAPRTTLTALVATAQPQPSIALVKIVRLAQFFY